MGELFRDVTTGSDFLMSLQAWQIRIAREFGIPVKLLRRDQPILVWSNPVCPPRFEHRIQPFLYIAWSRS